MFERERGTKSHEINETKFNSTLAAFMVLGALGLEAKAGEQVPDLRQQANETAEQIQSRTDTAASYAEAGTEVLEAAGVELPTELVFETTIDTSDAEETAERVDEVITQAMNCIEGEGAISKVKRVMVLAENLGTLEGNLDAAQVALTCADLEANLKLVQDHPKWSKTLADAGSLGVKLTLGDRQAAAEQVVEHAKAGAVKLGVIKLPGETGNVVGQIDAEGNRIGQVMDEISNTDSLTLDSDPRWKGSLSLGVAKNLGPGIASVKDALSSKGISAHDVLSAQAYSLGYSVEQNDSEGPRIEFAGTVMATRDGKKLGGLGGYLEAGLHPLEGTILGRDISAGGLIGYTNSGIESGSYVELESGHSGVKGIITLDKDGNIGTQLMYQINIDLAGRGNA